MKTFFDGIAGCLIIVFMLIVSVITIKYALLYVIFPLMDYNAVLGGFILIALLVFSIVVAGFAKTREYLPSIRQVLSKSHKKKENQAETDHN